MSLLSVISDWVKPITELVDDVHTSDEERLAAKARINEGMSQLMTQALLYEQKLMHAQASVIKAEAEGQGWLQRSWRPITMLTFLILIICDSFGWLEFRLSEKAWDLLQLGIGGYVVGRSAEKVLPKVADAFKKGG